MTDNSDGAEKFVIKTSLTPEQLAQYLGGDGDLVSSEATGRHVVFMPKVDFDADYKRRWLDLCERLDEIQRHVANGEISAKAERDVAWVLQWAIDQIELSSGESRKLIAWLMEANAELDKLRNADRGAKGGAKSAEKDHQVKARAIKLALERRPDGGWRSAPPCRTDDFRRSE